MPTPSQKHSTQHWIVYVLPVRTLNEAANLAGRFREGKAFRLYVLDRKRLVFPAGLLILLISALCAAAPVVFFGDLHRHLALPAVLLAPFVLVGSLFVQAYVFFSWLENRALARALGRRARPPQSAFASWFWNTTGVDLGTAPRIPWILVALFILSPLAMLASFAADVAAILVGLAILAPFVYSYFDR
ncbi:MAG TPA: hypothetical protein VNM24_05280 [Burkholderiales bacterium]|jgi:hypothetical protein|nr:hypothetical protein [Burkholderiales bacterium]